MKIINTKKFKSIGKKVVEIERAAIDELVSRIDEQFTRACEIILACKGRVIVIGMGKSGHIGNKIAATLASTGTPAFFVHPGEASHGDLGMITAKDVVMMLSNSGETDEIVALLPVIKRLNIHTIALVGKLDSTIAKIADIRINTGVKQEACPLGLAPTSSTTATLVMGDAISVTLLEARGFSKDDFAFSHPGGMLGRRLLLRVEDIMHKGDDIPKINEGVFLKDALVEMTQKGLGITTIIDNNNKLVGIFTDGDVRRALDSDVDVRSCLIKDIMTKNSKTINYTELAASALAKMEKYSINALVVLNENQEPIGILNMHDLLKARVV